jgi:hypothetical protein
MMRFLAFVFTALLFFSSCKKEETNLSNAPINRIHFDDMEVGQTSTYITFFGFNELGSSLPFFEYIWNDTVTLKVHQKISDFRYVIVETNLNPSLISQTNLGNYTDSTRNTYVDFVEIEFNSTNTNFNIKPIQAKYEGMMNLAVNKTFNLQRERFESISILGGSMIDFTNWGCEGCYTENLNINFSPRSNVQHYYSVLDILSGQQNFDNQLLNYGIFYEKNIGIARSIVYYNDIQGNLAYFGFDLF